MSDTSESALFLRDPQAAALMRRRRMAEQLQQSAMQMPIRSHGAGLAHILQMGLAGYQGARADQDFQTLGTQRREEDAAFGQRLAPLLTQGMQGMQGAEAPQAAPDAGPTATPQPRPQVAGGGSFFDRLGAAESSNDPNARNPRSSATGTFQFIDGTWRQFAEANPHLFRGMAPDQVMAARNDPAMSLRAAEWYAGVNGQALQAAGLPATPDALALGHRFGPQGAVTLLRADPNAPMASVMPANVITANPDLNGRTVGQVRDQFAQRFGGATMPQAGVPSPGGSMPQAAPPGTGDAMPNAAPQTAAAPGPARTFLAGPPAPAGAPTPMAAALTQGMPGQAPQGAPTPLAQSLQPRDQSRALMQLAMEAAQSQNPLIRERAQMLMQAAQAMQRQVRNPVSVSPGASLVDLTTGRPIYTAPAAPRTEGNNPFGNNATGQAANLLMTLGPRIENGAATPAEIQQYRMAADIYQREEFNPATGARNAGLPLPPEVRRVLEMINPRPVQQPVQDVDREFMATQPQAPQSQRAPQVVASETGSTRTVQPGANREPPATMQTAMVENVAAVRQVDRALAALSASGGNGVGFVAGLTPGAILDRTNPEGVTLRALIADIGSLKIHDRSGAVVTASEFPRLRPFIPAVGDSPETIRQKLTQFRVQYLSMLQDQYQAFGPSNGYRQNDLVQQFLAPPARSGVDAEPPPPAVRGQPAPSQGGGWSIRPVQ